jgi:hypothetical protein
MIEARFRSRNRRDRGYVHRAAWPTKSRPSLTANRRFLRSHQARPFRSADRQRTPDGSPWHQAFFACRLRRRTPGKAQCFFTTRFESAVHDEVTTRWRRAADQLRSWSRMRPTKLRAVSRWTGIASVSARSAIESIHLRRDLIPVICATGLPRRLMRTVSPGWTKLRLSLRRRACPVNRFRARDRR